MTRGSAGRDQRQIDLELFEQIRCRPMKPHHVLREPGEPHQGFFPVHGGGRTRRVEDARHILFAEADDPWAEVTYVHPLQLVMGIRRT